MTFNDCLLRFFKDEEGASGIEYALIAVMVAVVIGTFVPGIRTAVTGIFTSVQTGLAPAAAP